MEVLEIDLPGVWSKNDGPALLPPRRRKVVMLDHARTDLDQPVGVHAHVVGFRPPDRMASALSFFLEISGFSAEVFAVVLGPYEFPTPNVGQLGYRMGANPRLESRAADWNALLKALRGFGWIII
jgi:hypothetical protein